MGNSIDAIETADLDSSIYYINANSFSWKFENIRSWKQGAGKCIKSNKIELEVNGEPEKWQVLLYPDGFSARVKEYFSLWVKKLSDTERNVSFCCKIYNSESKLIVEKWTYNALTLETALGWSTFCKRSDIEGDETIQCDGTFRMDITVAFYTANKNVHESLEDYDTDKVKRSTDVCRSLKSLLVAETFSDITIVADDEEIKVHKAILSARSEVFRQLIELKSRLEDSCRLTFDDLSKDALKEMIRFIYAGEIGNVSFEVACELFYAADKYKLELLKQVCSKILVNSLNQDNVLRVLPLAERHDSMELKDSCLHYITSNKVQIQKQKEWKELLQKDPQLANSVIEEFAKRRGMV
ncbi:TD and POZ domain-containing protein 2 [Argiope bruennichi]|uniref:TD and POZ domain-containing protein 2 n=1 Tax=Argiope bruennichi TaxID=94029 RepID=A0A8T0G5N1_ARGBR|nr:TD and POZ domain-containing protein 2 [Argiope bruennichi]